MALLTFKRPSDRSPISQAPSADEASLLTVQDRRLRNSLIPVYKLPFELLVNIFEIILDALRWWQEDHLNTIHHFSNLYCLRQVSSRWNESIIASPSLWAYVDVDFTPAINTLALKRSKNVPLAVSWTIEYGIPMHITSKHFYKFAEIAKPHRHRIRYLRMELPTLGHFHNFFDGQAMPEMRRMELMLGDRTTSTDHHHRIDPCQGCTINIEHLDLDGVPLAWGSLSLTGLIILKLSCLTGSSLSRKELIAILHSNTRLNELSLSAINTNDRSDSSLQHEIIAQLPHLAVMDVSLLPEDLSSYIFHHIHAPQCRKVAFTGQVGPHAIPLGVGQGLRSLISGPKPVIGYARILVRSVDIGCALFEEEGDEVARGFISLCARQSTGTFEDALSLLTNVFQEEFTDTRVKLICQTVNFLHQPVGPSLNQVKGLESLHASADCQNVDRLLLDLAQSTVEGGVRQWPCPNLGDLALDEGVECTVEVIVYLLRSRGGFLHGKDTMPRVLPHQLTLRLPPAMHSPVLRLLHGQAQIRKSGETGEVAGR